MSNVKKKKKEKKVNAHLFILFFFFFSVSADFMHTVFLCSELGAFLFCFQ